MDEIRKVITAVVIKSKSFGYNSLLDLSYEISSFSFEAINEFDISKVKGSQINFIAKRSILRYIDDFRKRSKLRSKYKDKVKFCEKTPVSSYVENRSWSETKDKIELLYSRMDAGYKKNRIISSIFKDHLIPKVSGENFKTLKQIARENNLSVSRMSQLLHCGQVKNIINESLRGA